MKTLKYILPFMVIALLVSILLGACQQATLVSDEEFEDSRGNKSDSEEQQDSTKATPDFDINDWEGTDSVTFTFGAVEQKGGVE